MNADSDTFTQIGKTELTYTNNIVSQVSIKMHNKTAIKKALNISSKFLTSISNQSIFLLAPNASLTAIPYRSLIIIPIKSSIKPTCTATAPYLTVL